MKINTVKPCWLREEQGICLKVIANKILAAKGEGSVFFIDYLNK